MVVRGKEYMMLDVDKVVDLSTWGSCIPIDSVKSGDNYSNAYSDPYITPSSFDSDITNTTFHNSNQPCMLD